MKQQFQEPAGEGGEPPRGTHALMLPWRVSMDLLHHRSRGGGLCLAGVTQRDLLLGPALSHEGQKEAQ